MKLAAATALLLCLFVSASAEPVRIISEKRVRLGSPDSPEWEQFASDPGQPGRWEISFEAEANGREATLFIRQDDVKQEWPVEINGHRLGKLFQMEADLVHTLAVPAGVLRNGSNLLTILPPSENDDIVLHKIALDSRPPEEARREAIILVSVDDPNGGPLPCRITVVDERGTLAPIVSATVGEGANASLAIRPGVAYTGTGRARIGLPAGRYTVFASRGFEYGIGSERVELAVGESRELSFRLTRELPTPGLISCDPHIHTLTHSGHGDATLEERMLTLAGEHIELPIATEHNIHADYSESAQRLGLSRFFTSVIGNEVTTRMGHFNVFPVPAGAPVPDSRLTDWPQLMTAIRETPGVRVVVLNHPRSIHTGFRPFAAEHFNRVTGENKRGPEFTFDALEVVNSGAQQSDYMLVYRDWFALLNHGYRITAVGASDSHDVSRFIVGQARTYIAAEDDDPSRIDVAAACENLLQGRAYVSMGLLTRIEVEGKHHAGDLATGLPDQIQMAVTVDGPSWVARNHVELFANGIKIREAKLDIDESQTQPSPVREKTRSSVRWTIPRPHHDVHLVAIATGPAVTAPFWAMTRPYQPSSRHWQGRAIGSTNPVRLDADGDGQFTAARGYARRLIERHGVDPALLLPALGDFDEAVAAQAASLCVAAGANLTEPPFVDALRFSAKQVAQGFASYSEAATESGTGRVPRAR